METCNFTLVIPSLDPDEHLPATVGAAIEAGVSDIILVDDGSRPECRHYFTELVQRPEVTLLTHEINQGKGAALKTAFAWFLANRTDRTGVVTADSDGQHMVADILACGKEMDKEEPAVILGCRDFSQQNVPPRSRIGNRLTSLAFRLLFDMNISDTQTGLRAIPAQYIEPLMAAKGSRYEFETNMLLLMDSLNIPSREITVQTVYTEQNQCSHFRPIRDSLRIFGLITKYTASSLFSSGLDILLFFLFGLLLFPGSGRLDILLNTVLARVLSATANFCMNRSLVFESRSETSRTFPRYICLAVPIMLASWFFVYLISSVLSVQSALLRTIIKAPVDTVLFLISFRLQRQWVFGDEPVFSGEKLMNTAAVQRLRQGVEKLRRSGIARRAARAPGVMVQYLRRGVEKLRRSGIARRAARAPGVMVQYLRQGAEKLRRSGIARRAARAPGVMVQYLRRGVEKLRRSTIVQRTAQALGVILQRLWQALKKLWHSSIARRAALVLFTVLFVSAFGLVALVYTMVTGPSETVRDLLVLSATQASATKWVPGLFLDQELVDEIVARSGQVQEDVIPMSSHITGTYKGEQSDDADEWADAIDGMLYRTYSGSTYTAYILLVQDPSRVYVGTSSDYHSGRIGSRIFDIVKREGAVAATNAGEFADTNGQGTGDTPIGLTYSKGKCVWNDGARRTFIGFDSGGTLHAYNSITRAEADKLEIRDAVSFQTGNVLITNDGEQVTLYYAERNVGMAQRTAIGQRADGTVILVVTDGRTASSLGATRNDIIDLMVELGAVTAGMLDGGSSAMMYYEDYYTKYGIDTGTLDDYQLQGLTNRYKAFTRPRHMPTFFLVAPETQGE